jgi:hypothetical protein
MTSAWDGPSSNALTRYLALFLLLNAFVLNGILWLASPAPYKETVLQHTWDVLRAQGCDDSWGIMSVSYEYASKPHETPLYSEIFFNRKLKFQYPPPSLFVIAGVLRLVGPEQTRTQECEVFETPTLTDFLGWVFMLVSAVSAGLLLEIGLRRRLAPPSSGLMLAARFIVVLGLTLTFYPVVKAYTLGQIQNWLNGMFALALLCWATNKKATSGALIGLMALIKPHYGLFLLWAALRREWRFAGALTAMVAVGGVASIAAYGWRNHIDYVHVLMYLAQHGETFYPNQSFNGLFNRLMTLVDPVNWNSLVFYDNSFPPFSPWVYGGVLVTSILLLSAALLRRGNEGDPDRVFDFCTMALSITVASPIAWEHHYGAMFPVLAVLLAGVLGNRTRLILLTVSYVLISNFIPATNLLAPTVLNIVQSYLLAGALIALMLLHTARPGWQIVIVPAAAPVPSTRAG